MSLPRIILADDHRIFAEGLRALLSDEYDIVALVEDGQALLDAAREFEPDLVLTDLSMPKLNGIECLRRLRKSSPDLKVVLLTMHEDAGLALDCMRAGASGYLLKNGGAREVLHGLRQALGGATHVSSQLAEQVYRALELDRVRLQNQTR